jgi:hypothetical protein
MLTELASSSERGEACGNAMFALTSFHRSSRFELAASSQQVFGHLTGLQQRTHSRWRAKPRSKSNHALELTASRRTPKFSLSSTFDAVAIRALARSSSACSR